MRVADRVSGPHLFSLNAFTATDELFFATVFFLNICPKRNFVEYRECGFDVPTLYVAQSPVVFTRLRELFKLSLRFISLSDIAAHEAR